MPARAPDFESSASAIPPLRRLKCRKTRLLYSLPTVFQIAAGIKCRQSQAAAVAEKHSLPFCKVSANRTLLGIMASAIGNTRRHG